MTPRIESAEHVSGYIVRLRFADGIDAEIDFEADLWGEVFEPLKDQEIFLSFASTTNSIR